jgi:hypothetical protein
MQPKSPFRRDEVRSLITAFIATVAIAGCASHPNDIPAQDVSAARYNNYSCSDLGNEYRQLNNVIAGKSDDQRSLRLNDIYGYIFFPHMPLGRMMSSDREPTIALLKGEQSATVRMAAAKGCPGAWPVPYAGSSFILK